MKEATMNSTQEYYICLQYGSSHNHVISFDQMDIDRL